MPETYCGQQGWEVVEVYQDDGYTGMNMERPALQRILEAQKGQFTGCLAPFGYRKDPADKNHLLIDEKAAPIVRQIFGWAMEGHGPNFIRRRLEEQRIPCPTWWNRHRGMRDTFTKKKLYRFKIGAIGDKRPKDWIVVEGQHEALIDRGSNIFLQAGAVQPVRTVRCTAA